MADLTLIETGNGGDLVLRGNDLAVSEGFENMPYLGMFGGENWWGNFLQSQGDPTTLFTANTERVLRETVLNSTGRIRIESAIKADLSFLAEKVPGTKTDVSAFIRSDNRLEINIQINGQSFTYFWNPDTSFLTYRV